MFQIFADNIFKCIFGMIIFLIQISELPKFQYTEVCIDWDNCLEPNRQQAISWSNDEVLRYRRHQTSVCKLAANIISHYKHILTGSHIIPGLYITPETMHTMSLAVQPLVVQLSNESYTAIDYSFVSMRNNAVPIRAYLPSVEYTVNYLSWWICSACRKCTLLAFVVFCCSLLRTFYTWL